MPLMHIDSKEYAIFLTTVRGNSIKLSCLRMTLNRRLEKNERLIH